MRRITVLSVLFVFIAMPVLYLINKKEAVKSAPQLSSYLTAHTFLINGNDKVEFTNNKIVVHSGNATNYGNYLISGAKSAKISNFKAVEGEFDSTDNHSFDGTLKLFSDGTLSLSLSDGSDNRNYILSPKK